MNNTNRPRHFSEITEKEVEEMWLRCMNAANEYAKEINMTGLAHNGVHNIYLALHNALMTEYEGSKIAMKELK